MTESDINQVLKLEKLYLDSSLGLDYYSLSLESVYSYFLVATIETHVIGFISSTVDEYSEILNFVVDKDFRGQGIGSKLLNMVINEAKEKKSKSIYLEVNEINNNAIALYLKNGFKKDHVRKNYYKDHDAYVLIKEL